MTLLQQLEKYFSSLPSAVLAFSGGVDSTLLMAVGARIMGENLHCITFDLPYVPRREINEAIALAKKYGANHQVLSFSIQDDVRIKQKDTCYVCKHFLFTALKRYSEEHEITILLDGTNADDLGEDRPGLRALREIEVRSPLAALGFTKSMVRHASQAFGLPTWKKASYSCLLSRLPVGATVEEDTLARIEAAENLLQDMGFRGMRARLHGNLLRLEFQMLDLVRIRDEKTWQAVYSQLQELGFSYITVDMGGYRTGTMSQ